MTADVRQEGGVVGDAALLLTQAEVLRQALEDEPTSANPASFLQLAGDKVEVILDEAAASRLRA